MVVEIRPYDYIKTTKRDSGKEVRSGKRWDVDVNLVKKKYGVEVKFHQVQKERIYLPQSRHEMIDYHTK